LVRSTTRLPKEIQDKIKLVIGDIFNQEDVDKSMKDQDVVVSCLGKRLTDTGKFILANNILHNHGRRQRGRGSPGFSYMVLIK